MGEFWTEEPVKETVSRETLDEFKDLLTMFAAWRDKKSDNMPRLVLRLNQAYWALEVPKRRALCLILIDQGDIEPEVAHIIKTTNGCLRQLTHEPNDKK